MEVMDLICRGRRSLKYGESSVSTNAVMALSRCPVLAGHVAVICGPSTPCQPVTLIVRSHSMEAATAA
jgi:hypothetical protein